MLKALIKHYLQVLLVLWLPERVPVRVRSNSSDHQNQQDAAEDRRSTSKYKKKRNIVKNLWIASGLLMLGLPNLAAICTTALFTMFVSFMILDETP